MVMLFKVIADSYTEVTREADPDEEYSGTSTSTSYDILELIAVDDNTFDVSGTFNPDDLMKHQANVFLVYVTYDNGDSFSYQESANIEYLECFLTREKAQEVLDTIHIQNHIYNTQNESTGQKMINLYRERLEKIGIYKELKNENNFDNETFTDTLYDRLYYKDESDKIKFLANPWARYFENLDSAQIKSFTVKEYSLIKSKYRKI